MLKGFLSEELSAECTGKYWFDKKVERAFRTHIE